VPTLAYAGRRGLEAGTQLRNTFNSHALQDGIPLRPVQLWAGHSSSARTEAYALGAAATASVDVPDGAGAAFGRGRQAS